MVLDSELDVLRKEVDEIFCLLFKKGASPRAFFSLFGASSESDTRMGMGIEMGTFSAPFATGRPLILGGPEPPTFFFLATGCRPCAFPFPLVRELARELAPLEELVIAMLWTSGLFLE